MPGSLLCARDMRMVTKDIFPSKLLKGVCTHAHTHTHTGADTREIIVMPGGILETLCRKDFPK